MSQKKLLGAKILKYYISFDYTRLLANFQEIKAVKMQLKINA